MFRIAVCDDCPIQIKALLALLDTYKTVKKEEVFYKYFSGGSELLADMDSGGDYDLFLLDILMPIQNGIDLAREIRKRNSDVPLVFLTSSSDYALDAFDVSATHYILKPVNKDALFRVLDKITETLKREDGQYWMFPTADRVVKMTFASIVCVELFGRTLKVYKNSGVELLSKTIRSSFEEAAAPLLKDERYLRPHKSFILNMMWVEELTGTSFIMKNGINIPVPRYRYSEAKSKYYLWLAENGKTIVGMN